MRRRTILAGATGLAAAHLAAPALGQGSNRTLRFVPQANLASPDPVWTTATIAINHSMLCFDTLYGIDDAGTGKPQMVAGHEVSQDELTWTFTLRDGLLFHDNEKVLARDCVQSVKRWAVKDPFGQQLQATTNEIVALDDRRFQIRLKKPFRQMEYAFGARNCFMMPERMAKTPATEQIKEYVGSGPFRFLPDEWVSGARAAYARNDKYVPRQEPPSYFAGGKVVHIDRLEWSVQPDPATAAAALQTNEVDWVELPLIDLCPMLRKSPGIEVKVFDPYGWMLVLAFNHLYPPFDNVKLRRALLPALDQKQFVEAVVGDQAELGRQPMGYFTDNYPMANKAGFEAITGKRDLALARKLVQESGYKNEPIVLMSPSDQPAIAQLAQVVRSYYQELGLNVDFQSMDWGSLVSRRASTKSPADGGWNSFCTLWGGLTVSNPGSSYPLRANGKGGWFGWPTDERLEALRQEWFDAPDLAAQKKAAEQIQARAFEIVPFLPLGQVFQPTAFRSNITGIVPAAIPLFWNLKKG